MTAGPSAMALPLVFFSVGLQSVLAAASDVQDRIVEDVLGVVMGVGGLVQSKGDNVTTTTSVAPNDDGTPFEKRTVLSSLQFVMLIAFATLCYYISIYLSAKAVGENTAAMTAPARFAGSAANATGGVIGRFFKFLKNRGRVTYIPLAPSDGDFMSGGGRGGGTSPNLARRAKDVGHSTDNADFFSTSNDPAPSVN